MNERIVDVKLYHSMVCNISCLQQGRVHRYFLFTRISVKSLIFLFLFISCKHPGVKKPSVKPSTEEIKQAVEENPMDKQAIFNLGIAYRNDKDYNKAIESFSRVISLQPNFPNAYYERGYCYTKMGLFPQARVDMGASIMNQPDHGPSYLLRGRCFEALGDLKSACKDWQKAYELGVGEADDFIREKCNH